MTYTRPTETELPAALAEAMGWELELKRHRLRPDAASAWVAIWDWHPLTSYDHANLAVQRCAEFGLMHEFVQNLSRLVDPDRPHQKHQGHRGPYCTSEIWKMLLATPAQWSYAAHRTLTEYRKEQQ